MFKFKYALFVPFACFVLLYLNSCSLNNKKEPLSESVGKAGSLIITSDSGTLSGLNIELNNALKLPLSNLPSVQPFFELNEPDIETFSKFYYNQRTILVIVLPSNVNQMDELLEPFDKDSISLWLKSTKMAVKVQENLLAKNQHIVYLFANTLTNLKSNLISERDLIVNTLMQAELKDEIVKVYGENTGKGKFYERFKNKYGVGVNIPNGFKIVKENDNFYWFQKDTSIDGFAKSIGLIINAYPFTDSTDFSYVKIRNMRDSFCKYNISGSLKGTYMGTSESDFYPTRTFEKIKVNGLMAGKMRGWWTIKGMTMAGPFIRYVVQVPDKSSLFVFEGFIYQANINTKERDLRVIEAIASTIQ
ncbi:MAG: DUF4837 family protein [bacterium]|nr:DUF4837 family protein [bacterium]